MCHRDFLESCLLDLSIARLKLGRWSSRLEGEFLKIIILESSNVFDLFKFRIFAVSEVTSPNADKTGITQ